MTTRMTKTELTEKVGKKFFLADDYTLAGKLNYISGIPSFDKYLDGKTIKQINAVIHLTKYPKGLVIKIAKLFSSFPFGLAYYEIKRTLLTVKSGNSNLIFETSDNRKIIFSLKTSRVIDVKQFFNDIQLKYDYEDKRQKLKTVPMFKKPFSFDGRIRRAEYVYSFFIYIYASAIVRVITEEGGVATIAGLAYIPMLWFFWAQGAKRCHDRGNSGWYQIIPFYGFWMLFADSDSGINEYGPNPKGL